MTAFITYSVALVALLVLAAVSLRLWRPRRLRAARGAGRRLAIVEVLALSPGERVVIVECDGQQYMLGHGSGQLVLLDRLTAAPVQGHEAISRAG